MQKDPREISGKDSQYPFAPIQLNRARNRKTERGFTLIELLVVVVVIAILAALLLPALSRVKASSRRTTCLSNLKQIGLSVLMYAEEHNDTLRQSGMPNSLIWPSSTLGFQSPSPKTEFLPARMTGSITQCHTAQTSTSHRRNIKSLQAFRVTPTIRGTCC